MLTQVTLINTIHTQQRYANRMDRQSSCTTSGQEMQRVYSYNPRTHTWLTDKNALFYVNLMQICTIITITKHILIPDNCGYIYR